MRVSTAVARLTLLALLLPALSEAAATCPTVVGFEPTAGLSTVDTGTSGLAMGRPIYGNVLRFGIDCAATTPPCGTCPITGLLPDAAGMFQRCRDDTSIVCTSATEVADCGGPDTCAVFITVPQSTSVDSVSACYTHELTSPVTGTVGVESGAVDTQLSYRSRLYLSQIPSGHGCPSCDGDPVPNDGVRGGTCAFGTRTGLACDANGPSIPPWGDLGTSSFDCPPVPGTLIGTIYPGVVTYSTGTQSRTLDAASPNCTGAPGRKCFCNIGGPLCNGGPNAGTPCASSSECPSATCQTLGAPTVPNACLDDDSTPMIDETFVCEDTPPLGDGKGQCPHGPVDERCTNHPGHGCLTDADCDGVPGACGARARSCFVTTGAIGDTLGVTGVATPPAGDQSDPVVLGMITCLRSTGSFAGDDASGLPGITENLHVGRLTYFADASSPGGCPTAPATCRASVVSGKSQFSMKKVNPATLLRWRWNKGAATTLAELGDPTTSDHYDLCLYDATGLRASMVIPAGGVCGGHPCWKAAANGFSYRNKSGSPRGIDKLALKSGADGKASIKVDGKGDLLPIPALGTLTGSLQLQIRNRTSGLCWGTTFAPPFRNLTATSLSAKD